MRSLCLLLVLSLGLSLVVGGCSRSLESPARSRYNHGIDLMAQGDLERAESAFLDARNGARGDQPLRYSAAFNLGMLHLRKAEELEQSEAQKALAELEQARSWFQDAARVRSDDTDARTNLQIVGRKAQVLADQLNQGKNSLEARLDRVIEDERGLRDQVRELMQAVEQSGTQSDPIAFREAFEALATSERILMAEAGTISDLAADELAGLDGQDPEQMEQQDKLRQLQLRGLEAYLQSARVAIDDARRALRKLDSRRSHSQSTSALAHLKRAREQLLDPVTALKGVAQDQQELLSHTAARHQLGKSELSMPGEAPKSANMTPVWLSPEHLSERQGDALERCTEVLVRFQAASQAPPPADGSEVDAKTARALEMAGKAIPFLEATVASMQEAQSSLATDALQLAEEQETEALRNLFRAIEYFSDLKNLIELTYAEQQGVLTMLDPEAAASIPQLAEMDTKERALESHQAAQRNGDRLERMRALIAEELAQAQAQAQEQGGEEAAAGAAQTFDAAERFRASAADKLGLLGEMLQSISGGKALATGSVSPLQQAGDAQSDIEELRRIFYTIVEHLKELHRDQSETYDATGGADAVELDEERAALLPPLAAAQSKHAALAEALAQALEAQADAASASEDPKAQQEGQKFAAAAGEVRSALAAASAAASSLTQAQEDSAVMSVHLGPALEEQPVAIEHIQAAIEILEPPQQQEQDQEDEQQQDEQQQQEQQQEEISKQQAEKRLQEIRDREAERQREREERQGGGGEGVDKDW